MATPTFSPTFSPGSQFTPISPFPIIRSGLYINLLKVSPNPRNKINVDYSTLNISNYNIKKPYSIKIEGDIYFAYDISIPVIPYLYGEQFNPTKIFSLPNISLTNIKYTGIGTNPNMYYFKLSVNQVIPLRTLVTSFMNIRIYLSNPTANMIKKPDLENTIIFNTHNIVSIKPTLFPLVSDQSPQFILRYDTSFTEERIVLSETFTGFDIFGQFNICDIDKFGLEPEPGSNSKDIYKIIYTNNNQLNSKLISNYYFSSIWSERYVTAQLSDSALVNQSVITMHNILNEKKFTNFTKDIKILAAPYKYSFINYQHKIEPQIMAEILKNGFNKESEPYNSLLDYDIEKINNIKQTKPDSINELNDNTLYVGQIYCNPTILDSVMSIVNVKRWPRNAFEFNIAFFSYITYLMYDEINKTSPNNISKSETSQNKIRVFKITTPCRMNSPFIYRVDIRTFLTYLTKIPIKEKLENYRLLSSTLTIDLPTALLLSYYDKNPQTTAQRNADLLPRDILSSYFANQTILSGVTVPTVTAPIALPIQNVIERFDNINQVLNNKNDFINNKINNQFVKYALF
jgi:hypothetical protein